MMPKRRSVRNSRSECGGRVLCCLAIGAVLGGLLLCGGCDRGRGAPNEKWGVPASARARVVERVAGDLKRVRTWEEARDIIEAQFGEADRDIGSGFGIEQWDLDDGVLTLHQACGPTFAPASGGAIWLVETCNPLEENLLGGYEMMTVPESRPNGGYCWLGNVELRQDGTYRFIDSRSNLDRRAGQENNFFMLQPEGRFEIVYAAGLAPGTLLETLSEAVVVADVMFTSKGGGRTARYLIVGDPAARTLRFAANEEMEFQMYRGWDSYWACPD